MRRSSWGGGDVEVKQITLNGSEDIPWRYVEKTLPAYGQEGESYSYYFVETTQDDEFGISYSNSTDGNTFTGVQDELITITNTKHMELKVEKKWTDQADATQNVQFELYQVKTPIGGGSSGGGSENDTVTYTFNIVYHQVEDGIDVYQTLERVTHTFRPDEYVIWKPTYGHDAWSSYHPSGSPNTITSSKGESFSFVESSNGSKPFTYVFDLGLAGTEDKTITWETNNWFWGSAYYREDGMDGDYYVHDNWTHQFETAAAFSRMMAIDSRASGEVSLVGTYTLDGQNNWSMSFNEEDLQLVSDGQYEYTYFVKEVGMDGYTVVYDNNDGVNSGVITITNTKEQVGTVETTKTGLQIEKRWENVTGNLPQQLTFTITQQDAVSGSTTEHVVTVNPTQNPPTANNQSLITLGANLNTTANGNGNFTLNIENLPDTQTVNESLVYDYSYTVTEQPVPGFTTTVTGNADEGYVFVNAAPKLEIIKQWENEAHATDNVQFDLYQVKTPINGDQPGNNEPEQVVDVTYTFRIQTVNNDNGNVHTLDEITRTFKSNENIVWRPAFAHGEWNDYHPTGGNNSITSDKGDTYAFAESTSGSKPYEYRFELGLAGTENKTITWMADNWYWGNRYDGDQGYQDDWQHNFDVTTVQSGARIASGGEHKGTYNLNAGNDWHIIFTQNNFPLLPDDQYIYTYYVIEKEMNGYTVVYDNNEGISDGVITMTNTKLVPDVENTTTRLSLTKQWVNAADCMPDSLTFVVNQKDTAAPGAGETAYTVTVDLTQTPPAATCPNLPEGTTMQVSNNGNGNFTLYMENLPDAYKENGTTIRDYDYTATEQPMEGFTASVSGDAQYGYTFVNTATELKVEKQWANGAAQKDMQFKLWRKLVSGGTQPDPEPGQCPGCGEQIAQGNEGTHAQAGCGISGHYVCDHNDHNHADCGQNGHFKCDGNDHGLCQLCGNRLCTGDHGEGVCNGGSGTITCPGCNQQITAGDNNHRAADCGTAGHYVCDGKDHGRANCWDASHHACDGQTHGQCRLCWELLCNGKEHGQGICVNNGGSGTITCPGCNQQITEGDNNHSTADCGQNGHFRCDGSDHGQCQLCGNRLCTGSHGEGVCNGGSSGGGESITLSATIKFGNDIYPSEHQLTVGDTVVWTFTIPPNDGYYPDQGLSFSYGGQEVTFTPERDSNSIGDSDGDGRVTYTSSPFTVKSAEEAGISIEFFTNFWKTWDQSEVRSVIAPVSVARFSRAYALGNRAASETVDTTGATDLGTYTLSASNNWQQLIHGLPMTDENGNVYLYFVEEIGTDGYIVSYQNNEGIAPNTGNAIVITNTKPEDVVVETTTDLTLNKLWQGAEDYKPESLTFTVTQQNQQNGSTVQHNVTVDLTQDPPVASCDSLTSAGATFAIANAAAGTDGWTLTITGLPDTRTVNGATTYDYAYTAAEQSVEGFSATTSGDAQNGYTFTNTRNTTTAAVEKQWGSGTPEAKPAVTMVLNRYLEQNGSRLEETVGAPVILNGSEQTPWNQQWNDLPTYGAITGNVNGTQTTFTGTFVYYITEEPLPGYTAVSTPEDGSTAAGKVTFVNTPLILDVEKEWAEGTTPTEDITFELYQIKTPVVVEEPDPDQPDPDQPEEPQPVDVTITFELLRRHTDGNVHTMEVITRTFKSNEYIIWKPTYGCTLNSSESWHETYRPSGGENSIVSSTGETITFTESISSGRPYTYVFDLGLAGTQNKTISWYMDNWYWGNRNNDNNGSSDDWSHQFETSTVQTNAIQSRYMRSATGGTLVGTYTLSAANGWHMAFTQGDFPLVPDGEFSYTYYVVETGMEGYTVVYDNNEGISTGTITIINSKDDVILTTPTDLTITKQWQGAEDYKPNALTFRLKQQDTVAENAQPTEHVITVDLTQTPPATTCQSITDLGGALSVASASDGSDGWTLTLTNLPDTHSVNGAYTYDYAYTLTEDTVDGFTATITGDEESGFTVTNARATTSVTVEKQWGNGTSEIKPAVTVSLYRYIAQENGNVEELVTGDGIENPVRLNGNEVEPWHHTWTNLPTHGSLSSEQDGQTTALTGAYTYYVKENPVDGYAATYQPEGGVVDAEGNVVITNTPSVLYVQKQWEGYTAEEVGSYFVALRVTNANGDTVDPVLFNTGRSALTINGQQHCFEVGYDESVPFYGLPAGDYTVTEIAWRTGDGAWQPIENEAALEWKVQSGTVTMPETISEDDETVTVTNTKRTQLLVEKQWGEGAAKQTMEFKLWRRLQGGAQPEPAVICLNCGKEIPAGEEATHTRASCGQHYTCDSGYSAAEHVACEHCGQLLCSTADHSSCGVPEISCSNNCGNPVQSADEHKLPCGHYSCAAGYNAADHAACEHCGQLLCGSADHSSCGAVVPENTVDITFIAQSFSSQPDNKNQQDVQTLTGIPVGATVEWKVETVGSNWYHSPGNEQTTMDYYGENVTVTRQTQAQGEPYIFTARFTVKSTSEKQQTITMVFASYWQEAEFINQSITYTAPTASTLSLRNTARASESIDLTGAELVGTYQLNEANSWQQLIYDLPATNENGVPYEYFVEELDADEYDVSYDNNGGIAPDGGVITIQNDKPYVPTVDVAVAKAWLDAEGAAMPAPNYAVHYQLWAVGGQEPIATGVLNQNNNWSATHTGLDASASYYVVETSVLNGSTEMMTFYDTTYQPANGQAAEDPAQAAVNGGTVSIINQLKPTYSLPETGGVGPHLYTGTGALLIFIALGLLYKGNKGKRRAD